MKFCAIYPIRIVLPLVVALQFFACAAHAETGYSPGGWPTLHHDAGNRRAVQARVVDVRYRTWHAPFARFSR